MTDQLKSQLAQIAHRLQSRNASWSAAKQLTHEEMKTGFVSESRKFVTK